MAQIKKDCNPLAQIYLLCSNAHMTNAHNKKLAEIGRKRRAMFLRIYQRGGITHEQLARKYGVSRQCMSVMIKRAKEDLR